MTPAKYHKPPHILPDFELGPLKAFDPDILLYKDKADADLYAFILALSLIFNDAKNLIWLQTQVKKGAPAIPTVCPYFGQYTGIFHYLIRLQIGLFHALMELLDESTEAIAHPKLQTCINGMSKETRSLWDELINRADTWDNKTPNKLRTFRQFLHMIRSKSIFHYDKKLLSGAYRDFFTDRSMEHTKHAYLSTGKDMDATRFYFADGMAEQMLLSPFKDEGMEARDALVKFTRLMNAPLRTIVLKFIDQARGSLNKTIK
jgi:hypothetical protein